jgi:hypothetical protein
VEVGELLGEVGEMGGVGAERGEGGEAGADGSGVGVVGERSLGEQEGLQSVSSQVVLRVAFEMGAVEIGSGGGVGGETSEGLLHNK